MNLAKGPFSLYLASRFGSSLSAASVEVLVPVVAVAALDANASDVGLLLVVMLAVSIPSRLVAGDWADRHGEHLSRLWRTQAIAAVLVLVPAIAGFFGVLSLWGLAVWAAAYVSVQAVAGALGHGVVNRLTEPDQRPGAIGRLNSVDSTAEIVGQAGAPALTALGPSAGFALPALTSAAASLCTRRLDRRLPSTCPSDLRPVAAPTQKPPRVLRRMTRTLARFQRSVREPLGSTGFLATIVVAAGGALVAPLVPVLALRDLGIPVGVYGLLLTCGGASGIVTGLGVGRAVGRFGTRVVATSGAGLSAAGLGVLAAAVDGWLPGIAGVALFEALTAAGGVLVMASVFGELQRKTPLERISSVMSSAQVCLEAVGLAFLGVSAVLLLAVSAQVGLLVALAVTVIGIPLAGAGRAR